MSAQTPNTNGTLFEEKVLYCCEKRFGVDEVLQNIRLPAATHGVARIYKVLDVKERKVGYGFGFHAPFNAFLGLYQQVRVNTRGVAWVLQDEFGAGAVAWSVNDQRFEQKTVGRANPILLSPKLRLAAISLRSRNRTPPHGMVPKFFVWSQEPVSLELAQSVADLLQKKYRLDEGSLYLTDEPVFWFDDGPSVIQPDMGLIGEEAVQAAKASEVYHCTWRVPDQPASCYRAVFP